VAKQFSHLGFSDLRRYHTYLADYSYCSRDYATPLLLQMSLLKSNLKTNERKTQIRKEKKKKKLLQRATFFLTTQSAFSILLNKFKANLNRTT